MLEDETGYKLTDVLEIHFLELPKLQNLDNLKDKDDPILEWLEFLDASSKEGMEMLAKKNENIKEAYEILQKVSNSKEARMAYEARQAEIMDQLTREETAKEVGIDEGILLTKKVLKLSTEGYTASQIAKECNISESKVINILE